MTNKKIYSARYDTYFSKDALISILQEDLSGRIWDNYTGYIQALLDYFDELTEEIQGDQ